MRKKSLPRVLTERKVTVPKNILRIIGGIVAALLIITLCIWGGSSLLNNLFVSAGPTRTAQPTKTRTPPPTQVSVTLSPTSVPVTPTLGIGSTMTSPEDGMTLLYVPAGKFTMGSDIGESDEKPVHTVSLDAFWIDQTEVTNAMYAKCVLDGECKLPSSAKSSTRDRYYGNFEFDDYPVIYVVSFNWEKAAAKGMADAGAPFSGKVDFIRTEMLWPITHMVAPRAGTVACSECHSRNGGFSQGRMKNVPGLKKGPLFKTTP